eukprot:822891-Pelagomonas_calceolata.AAC.2
MVLRPATVGRFNIGTHLQSHTKIGGCADGELPTSYTILPTHPHPPAELSGWLANLPCGLL